MTRHLTILLATLVAIQTVLGGSGGAAFCLGGGHEHAADEDASQCELACEHGVGVAPREASDDHDDRCSCTDIELELSDIRATVRPHDLSLDPVTTHAIATFDERVMSEVEAQPPPRSRPSLAQHHRALRTIRLTI